MSQGKLSLEWRVLDEGHAALVFDRDTWRLYEHVAVERGTDAQNMITKAVAALLGTVLFER